MFHPMLAVLLFALILGVTRAVAHDLHFRNLRVVPSPASRCLFSLPRATTASFEDARQDCRARCASSFKGRVVYFSSASLPLVLGSEGGLVYLCECSLCVNSADAFAQGSWSSVDGFFSPFSRTAAWAKETTWWDGTKTPFVALRDTSVSRRDYRDVVLRALSSIVAVDATPVGPPPEWTSYWGLHLDDVSKTSLRGDQQINGLPFASTRAFGDKDSFHFTNSKAKYMLDLSVFTPDSYSLPSDAHVLVQRLSERRDEVWALKIPKTWSGSGISIETSDSLLRMIRTGAFIRSKGGSVIVQRYVHPPATINGHKFDVRWWALVVSARPLRVYMLSDGYLKVAHTRLYSESFKDLCAHLTNGAIQSSCGSKGRREALDFPVSARDDRLPDLVAPSNLTFERMWSEAQRVLKESLRSAKSVLEDGANQTPARSYQLLSVDVVYDRDGTGWLLEVNLNGYLGAGIVKMSQNERVLRDMFRLVGVAGYEREAYQPAFEKRVQSAFSPKDWTTSNLRLWQEKRDEEAALSDSTAEPRWVRLDTQ